MPQKRRSSAKQSKPKGRNRTAKTVRVFASFEEAEAAEREYWWSRTPAERLRELERLRQLNYGYGQGKSFPRFQRILRIAELEGR